MREIKLTHGRVALVDDDDFNKVSQYKWHVTDYGYAATKTRIDGKQTTLRMHRLILSAGSKTIIDHRDHNRLNNQKDNLRICTNSENMMNMRKRKNGTSKYKGVSIAIINKRWKYYCCRILVNGRTICKTFPFTPEGEIEAAKAYNELALKYFGKFAHINKLES